MSRLRRNRTEAMTLADLLEMLVDADLNAPIRLLVYEQGATEPLLSNCEIRDVREVRGDLVIDVEGV